MTQSKLYEYGLRCGQCHRTVTALDLKQDDVQHPPLPNTLTNLPDHNSVDWRCPNCGYWNKETTAQTNDD